MLFESSVDRRFVLLDRVGNSVWEKLWCELCAGVSYALGLLKMRGLMFKVRDVKVWWVIFVV